MATFLLVHSPLVGPYSWSLVAADLRRRGVRAAVPVLRDRGAAAGELWRQQALSAAVMLNALPREGPVVLAGHSGAGPLLPAIRELNGREVDAYLFVDAGIPEDGASRLDLLRGELPEMAAPFAAHLEAGGRYPEWDDVALAAVLPDAEQRSQVLAEMQPRDRPFWMEPLPVFAGWPDAPCGYLRLSAGYAVPAARARADGWVCEEWDGGHFDLLARPGETAGAMLDLVRAMGIPLSVEARR
jgi:hypothetical protein